MHFFKKKTEIQLQILIMVCFCFFSTNVFAQEKFYAKGASVAYTGKTYKVSYTLENASGSNWKLPNKYDGFQLVSQGQNSSYNYVNGRMSQSISYVHYLQPSKEGTFTIPSASVTVDNKSLITEPFTVEVKKGTTNAGQANQNGSSNNTNNSTSSADWNEQAKESIFLRMYTDKTEAYVGEQITVYIKYYSKVRSYNTQFKKMPEFNGFWKQEFDTQDQDWKKEEYNGKYYDTYLVGKYAIFPQKDGQLSIDPMEMTTVLQVQTGTQNRGWFSFPSYEQVQYDFSSNKLAISAKNLPSDGKPQNFSGAVGSFNYSITTDSTNLKTGEPFKVYAKLNGTGNVMMVEMPEIDFSKKVETFDPQSKEYISKNATRVNGTFSQEYTLIPHYPGALSIPPTTFSYFDPTAEKYETIKSDRIDFRVKGEITAPIVKDIEAEEAEEEALMTLKPNSDNANVKSKEKPILASSTFYGAMAGAPLFLMLFLFARKKIENYTPDLIAIKNRKAKKIAQKHLKSAHQFLLKKEKKGFYKAINVAFWGYISDKLNLPESELNRANILQALKDKHVSGETGQQFIDLVDRCEMALYSPLEYEELQSDYEKATNLIVQIESELQN